MQTKLIALRKERGVTQREIAQMIKVSIKTYSKKELGKSEFTMNEMFEISNYFKLTIEDIFLPSNTPKWS